MPDLMRLARHLIAPQWWVVRRTFPPRTLAAVERAIAESEATHGGEIRFVVEGALDLLPVWRGQSPRARAIDVFSLLRVWDTDENSGVLLYVQLVDRSVQIVADRGIAKRVAQAEWDRVAGILESAFRRGAYEQGAVEAVDAVTRLLAAHFPPPAGNPNELPDRPVVL